MFVIFFGAIKYHENHILTFNVFVDIEAGFTIETEVYLSLLFKCN